MEKEYRHNNKVAIYRSADGETQLSVEIDKDTVWLNANQMAELFGRDSKTIRKHINNALSYPSNICGVSQPGAFYLSTGIRLLFQ